MRGKKTGGRVAGTPNKVTSELRDAVEEKYPGFNALVAFLDIYHDKQLKMPIRLQALREYAKYTHPTLKSIDVVIEQPQKERQCFKIAGQTIYFD